MKEEKMQIGEFSTLTGISKRMLRHYDKLELLKPDYVDDFTGYRFYHMNQQEDLNKIKYLQDFGFSLNEIKEILSRPLSYDVFISRLKDHEANLRNETDKMTHHLLKLKHFISYVESNPEGMHHFSLKEYDIQPLPANLDTALAVKRSIPMKNINLDEIRTLPSSLIFLEHIDENFEEIKKGTSYFITMDVDNFMYINDDFGFDVGDLVLAVYYQQVATAFKDLLASSPFNAISRLGGDEFGLLLKGTTDELILEACENVLKGMRSFDFSTVGCNRNVSCSIGVAKIKKHSHPQDLRHQSTKALLDAKRNGRDCYKFIEV